MPTETIYIIKFDDHNGGLATVLVSAHRTRAGAERRLAEMQAKAVDGLYREPGELEWRDVGDFFIDTELLED